MHETSTHILSSFETLGTFSRVDKLPFNSEKKQKLLWKCLILMNRFLHIKFSFVLVASWIIIDLITTLSDCLLD